MKILIPTILTFLFGCTEVKHPETFQRYNEFQDSVQIDYFSLQEFRQRQRLNLPSINNGVDSFELRLWTHGPSWEGNDLFIVKYDTSWKAFHYFLEKIVDTIGKTVKDFSDSTFLVKYIRPAYGWNKYLDSMNLFNLDTLPTQSLIPGFIRIPILDGHSYEIEIATKKYYRRLEYTHPNSYKFKQSKIFAEFIDMFKRHFGNDPEWFGYY